jgi:hypothetical protein
MKIKIPYLLIVTALLWAPARLMGWDLSPGELPGLLFLFVCLFAGFAEVYKGADVGLFNFKVEQAISIVNLLLVAAMFSFILIPRGSLALMDFVVAGMVFADAWISPVVAYATALRNFAANTDPQ